MSILLFTEDGNKFEGHTLSSSQNNRKSESVNKTV